MSLSKSAVKKVKKVRIKWREVIFNLHRREISEAFDLFRVGHPDMSINRCAYNVLKTYYSPTALANWKDMFENWPQVFHYSYVDVISCGNKLRSISYE